MNRTILRLIITGILLSGFSMIAYTKNHIILASNNGDPVMLHDRSDSISYAVGLLLGQSIKDSIAGYDAKLFQFCFLAGIQDSSRDRINPEAYKPNLIHRLVTEYKKQHPDSLEITESEIPTQIMSAYSIGILSMMSVAAHLLFDGKPGNPEILCDAVLSGAELNPTGRNFVMNFEECKAYLESGDERLKNVFETILPPIETYLPVIEVDTVADTLPATSRKAGNGYRAVPLHCVKSENEYATYRAAGYEFRLYDDMIALVDTVTKEVRTRFCGISPQTDGKSHQRSRVCNMTLFKPEGNTPILLIVDRADVFGFIGSLLLTIEESDTDLVLHYAGELKLCPYGDEEPLYTSGIMSVNMVKNGGSIRLTFGSGEVVYDPLGMSYTVPAENISYLYDGDTLRLDGLILQDKKFRLELLYAMIDSEGGAKDNSYAYGDIDGDGHDDLVYILANDPRRVSILLLENFKIRERIEIREELPYVPFISADEDCMIQDGILILWEDTETKGELPPYHRYRLREKQLELIVE